MQMTRQSIIEQTIEILVERFPTSSGLEPDAWTMQNVSEWDSMAHVEIVVTLEKCFGIEADAALVEAQNLIELVTAVEALQAAEHRA
jgi:acyl carrier protein